MKEGFKKIDVLWFTVFIANISIFIIGYLVNIELAKLVGFTVLAYQALLTFLRLRGF